MLLPIVPHSMQANTSSETFPQKAPMRQCMDQVQLLLHVTPLVQGTIPQLKDHYLRLRCGSIVS